MSSKKMFLSFLPWLLFSVVVNRRGADAAAIAALGAAALSVVFLLKDATRSGIKIIDVTGILTFGTLGMAGVLGGQTVDDRIADFGRGGASVLLGVIMLISAATVPFTEQYARESVPREHWHSPVFRAVNRKISVLWGVVVLAMGGGHLLAGVLDPASNPVPGARPVDLLLNWVVPIALILLAIKGTEQLARSASSDGPAAPVARHEQYR